MADHVPDNLSQDLDPNVIACLMAVDGAEIEFLSTLQITCINRMGDICSGKNGVAVPSQVIDCLNFETQRGIGFLETAVNALPEAVEKVGYFGFVYEGRRDRILKDVETLKTSPEPQSIEIATQQVVTMATSAIMVLLLARETGTKFEAHVNDTFGEH